MKTIYYDPDKNRFFRVISKNQFFANCGGYARSYSDAHTTRSVMSVDRRYLHGCKVVVDVADFADYDPVIGAWFVRDR